MKYLSAKSILTDPYRAGLEIGAALATISPEVVLLFASMSYDPDFSDFFEALYDGLGSESVIVFGGTGDGIYETSGAENYGVTALGISSDGRVAWSTAIEQGVQADSFAAARACAAKILASCPETPVFRMVLADGAKADGHAIVGGITAEIPGAFFGGLTGDDRKFTSSKVFLNGKEYEDTVAMLSGCGEISMAINAASGWTPIGNRGVVEENLGCEIRTINGESAQAFMAGQLGKPLGESDIGIVPLAAYQTGSTEHFFLRTPSHLHDESGAVTTFGSVEKGTVVRVCIASRDDVTRGVTDAMQALAPESLGFIPAAAIIISCAGRKWLLADKGEKELAAFFKHLGYSIPLIGFPSFGEISPFRNGDCTYTSVNFHNVTIVVCLLG
ncbi:MAG: FIST C-terminal domain-containing protein [Desulfuromonadaceae bacterium]|nr:FIST C-terminal domain-containing protein [Desulfuromonadaceae bacterium]